MIFYRKGVRHETKKGQGMSASAKAHESIQLKLAAEMYDIEDRINFSVFPGLQGGPHNHTISALATALKQAQSPEYVAYQKQVVSNSAAFAKSLMNRGYALVSGGTDNHLVLVNLRDQGIDGARVEFVLEHSGLAVNKNTVPGDTSALIPHGIRMGTPALTTRGFKEQDFDQVADFFHRGVEVAKQLKSDPASGECGYEVSTMTFYAPCRPPRQGFQGVCSRPRACVRGSAQGGGGLRNVVPHSRLRRGIDAIQVTDAHEAANGFYCMLHRDQNHAVDLLLCGVAGFT